MILDRLVLDNFLTYDHLDYSFVNKPLLVQGLNLTDDKQKSNGSGKSGMQTGIEFCIAGTNSRDVRDSELVSFGQKEGRAQLYSSCDVRKETLHIDWLIKVKGSNVLKLSIFKDGNWNEVSFSNINDGKKFIIDWFAITKEDLFNYFIINKTRFKSFFKSSNKEKVALINRFSDASIIEGIEKIDDSDLKEEYELLKSDASKIEGKIELVKSRISYEKSRDLESEMKVKIDNLKVNILSINKDKADLKSKIKELKLDIVELKEDISKEEDLIKERKLSKVNLEESLKKELENLTSIESELKEANILLESFEKTDWSNKRSKYELELDRFDDELDVLEEKESKYNITATKASKLIESIEIKLSGLITCPNCAHEFILDGDVDELKYKLKKGNEILLKNNESLEKVSEKIESVKSLSKNIELSIGKINKLEEVENRDLFNLEDKVNSIKNRMNKYSIIIGKIKSKNLAIDKDIVESKEEINSLKSEQKDISFEIKELKSEISSLDSDITSIKDNIESLKVVSNEELLESLEQELSYFNVDLLKKQSDLSEVSESISEIAEWSNNFKQFKIHLANKSLEVIEYHSNRYLKDMGSDLKVGLEGYKVLASGKVKDEITANIFRGGTTRTFNSFSGGEQGRLLFSSILANRHMINSNHPYGGLDFLSIDEVFEGVDSLGLKYLIKAAKDLGISVMIITHVTDEDVTEDVLMIVKRGGVSKIE